MRIEICDYPVFMRLGVFPEEQEKGHEALVSLAIDLPEQLTPGKNDDLDLTVDYARVISLLDEEIRGGKFHLIETVVDRVGALIFEHFAVVNKVSVTVEKREFGMDIKGARIKISQDFERK